MQSISSTNSTWEVPPTYSGPVILIQFISLGLIIAVGSAGNALVIYAFCRYLRIRRKTPHTYMLAFATVDFIRVLLCFPIVFVTVVHPLQVKYGTELCQAVAFTNVFGLVGNSLCVCAMTLDRYLDNKHRALYRRKCQSVLGMAILVVQLSLAFICTFPAVYSNSRSQSYKVEALCTFPHHYSTGETNALPILSSVTIAFCVTNIVYVRLFFLLRGRRKMRPVIYEPAVSENWGFYDPRVGITVRNRWQADSIADAPVAVVSRNVFHSHPVPTNYEVALWRSKKQKDNEKLTKLCFIIHVIFSVSWLPYFCTLFYLVVGEENQTVPEWIEIIVTWLTFIQVIITPFAYFSMSGLTRRKFRMMNGKQFSPTLSSSST